MIEAYENVKNIVDKIWKSKEEYHQSLAKLPIEEKIKLAVEIQKWIVEANPKSDKRIKYVWKI